MSSSVTPEAASPARARTCPKRSTNHDLEKLVDTSDEWIRERTGIGERRVAADGEAASDMAVAAARRALEAAGLTPADLDMIVVGTISADMPLPACAAFVQQKLGCSAIPAFDVAAACAGFLYALSIGDQFIRTGLHKNVLVVGVELLSRVLNWKDRTTCVLFGDGAGAAVLCPASGDDRGVLSTRLYTDATLAESLCIPAGGSREPVTPAAIEAGRTKVHMIGGDIFKVAVRNLTSASREALEVAGLHADEVRWVVPHQANLRILSQVAQRLDIPMERFVLNIERYGNTSSASIPIALDEAVRDGRIRPGDTVLMCALGAGISWARALARM
ncbi:MAG: beta-ketoacyl-ACP synthase III [Polyangiaceae bacterium]